MSTFNIYKSHSGAIEAVKKGWSWPGFFFGFIWAFAKGLNGIGAAILIGAFVLGIMRTESQTADTLLKLGGIVTWIWLGAQGNELRENNLKKKGYAVISTVTADTPEGAIASMSKDPESVNGDNEFICDQCGAPAPPDAKFCSKCGVKLD
jgi:hypothetical protein